MSSFVTISIHSSQFPEQVRQQLLESLRTRCVNHKFHYDSHKQALKWLALHEAYSPARTDPDCAAIYESSFKAAATRISGEHAHVVGLGCGGGRKDVRLLEILANSVKELFYTPSDVSVALVLEALQLAIKVVPEENCFPIVCDLQSAPELQSSLAKLAPDDTSRLLTFFGMIPNFEPDGILPQLARLVRAGDLLLFSANLAPGSNYGAGLNQIMPLYDNALTRDWLMTFLLDLGMEANDGEIRFSVEDVTCQAGLKLKRVTAHFHLARECAIQVDGERFEFKVGDAIRLFFSYRHTPAIIKELLTGHGLRVLEQWTNPSEEEAVFLVERE
jgi:uncharacterized SAM-dependent methyltransferase